MNFSVPTTYLARNQSLLNQALAVVLEQGGLGLLRLSGFSIQAGDLEQLQEVREGGTGTGPPWWGLGELAALSTNVEMDYLGGKGGRAQEAFTHIASIIDFHEPWWGMPGIVQAGMQQYPVEYDAIPSSCGPMGEGCAARV